MVTDNHKLISDLSEEYADRMSDGDRDRVFSRGCLAASYILGAEKTLRRICNVIKYSAEIGGITSLQSIRLLTCIEAIESMPLKKCPHVED